MGARDTLRFARVLAAVLRDPLFDAEYYRWANPDVPAGRVAAAIHFARNGWQDGRDPSIGFETGRYLDANPDVRAHRMNALAHWRLHGRRDRRDRVPVQRRFFVRPDGSTDRAALAEFLRSDALRSDRSRAVPALARLVPDDAARFGRMLEVLVTRSRRAADALVAEVLGVARRDRIQDVRIVIEPDASDPDGIAALVTWCSLAADPRVEPATIRLPAAIRLPGDGPLTAGPPAASDGTVQARVRVAAGTLVLPGSVRALVDAALESGRVVFGEVLAPDGTRERRWMRSVRLEDRAAILSASADDRAGPPLLIPGAVSVSWPELPPDERPRVLVMDTSVPRPDRDSGSVSAVNLMLSMQALGYRVTFVPAVLEHDPHATTALEALGVEVVDEREVVDAAEVIEAVRFDIAMLLRPDTMGRFGPMLRAASPATRIISVPMDVHFLRLGAQAQLQHDSALVHVVERYRELELANLALADVTVTGSSSEVDLLTGLAPAARVVRLPVARPELVYDRAPFAQRRDVVFIGGFLHPPNPDAVHWFLDEVWPRVASALPDARFVVYGSDLPDVLRARADDRVVMHGYIEHLEDGFRAARLSVVPLRFGAGYKGKIVSAMRAGVPIVSTSVGADGMDLHSLVIADGARDFADAIIALWSDEHRIEQLAQAVRDEAAQRFTSQAQREALTTLIANLGLAVPSPQ